MISKKKVTCRSYVPINCLRSFLRWVMMKYMLNRGGIFTFLSSFRVLPLTPPPLTWLSWMTWTSPSEASPTSPPPPGANPAASTAKSATTAACGGLAMTGPHAAKHPPPPRQKRPMSSPLCLPTPSYQERRGRLQRRGAAQFPRQHAAPRPPAVYARQPEGRDRGPVTSHHARIHGERGPRRRQWRHQRLKR